jgi:hypothetical protein
MDNSQHSKPETIQNTFHYTSVSVAVPKDIVTLTAGEDPNLTKIKDEFCSKCHSLQFVQIPNSVKEIGYKAFFQCSSLESITIPQSLIAIGRSAFQNCTSLKSICIPNSVTTIQHAAFQNCTSIKKITLPNSVENISCAFRNCSSLTSINIPKSVRNMEDAFRGCTSLTSANIPSSVVNMIDAFGGCTSLTSIALPSLLGMYEFNINRSLGMYEFNISNRSSLVKRAFGCCTSLDQRRPDGINYKMSIEQWLDHRFDNLPIHQACYDIEITPTKLSSYIQKNKKKGTLVPAVDAMGMTALHVLCCNPNVTSEMIAILKDAFPEAVNMTNVMNMNPLMLFLKCQVGCDKEGVFPGIHEVLDSGLAWDRINCVLTLLSNDDGDNDEITFDSLYTELEKRNDDGLLPFMVAAASSPLPLYLVYILAAHRPDLI